jgi:hypothetical protein
VAPSSYELAAKKPVAIAIITSNGNVHWPIVPTMSQFSPWRIGNFDMGGQQGEQVEEEDRSGRCGDGCEVSGVKTYLPEIFWLV